MPSCPTRRPYGAHGSEVRIAVRWLDDGAFDAQGVRPVPSRVFLRRLGVLNAAQMAEIDAALGRWFGMRA